MILFILGVSLVALSAAFSIFGADAHHPLNKWDAFSQVALFVGTLILFTSFLTALWGWLG